MNSIGLSNHVAIYINYLIPFLYDITFSRNNPFYEIFLRILRIFKNNYIPFYRFSYYQYLLVGKGNFCSVQELVDKDVISDKKGRNH